MRLEHQFSVPAPPDAVWAAVIDPERVAPCMPGATLTEVDGAEFTGGVKVKLGPVSLLYKGSGQFLETDEQARRVVIKAAGKDSRGNGTASATVTVTLSEEAGGTKGTVVTDLTITGKPAQFGRGMIVEVGGKILDTFANCLAGKLGAAAESPAEQPEPAPPKRRTRAKVTEPAPQDTTADTTAAADSDTTDAEEPPPQAKPKPATRRRTAAASKTAAAKAASSAAASSDAAETTPAPAPPDPAAANGVVADVPAGHTLDTDPIPAAPRLHVVAEPDPAAPRKIEAPAEAEPIDLLDYAGPSVAKRLVPAVIALIVLILVMRRLRHR